MGPVQTYRWRTPGFAALMAVAVLLGRATRLEGSELALVWPAAAVSVLWLRGGRPAGPAFARPGLRRDVVVLLLVVTAVNCATGAALPLALVFAVANLVHAGVVIVLFRRWQLSSPRDLMMLLAATVAGSAASAAVGSLGSWLLTGSDLPSTAAVWTIRNSVSFVLVAAGLRGRSLPRTGDRPGWSATLLLVAVGGAGYLGVFALTLGLPVAFLVLPIGAWVAVLYATTIVAWYTAAAAALVVALTLAGRGPFALLNSTTEVLLAQTFLAVSALLTLMLALYRDERQHLVDVLVRRDGELSAQTELLQTVFESISDGVAVADADGAFVLHNAAARALLGLDLHPDGPAGPEAWEQRYGITRPDGSPFPPAELPLARALEGERSRDVDLRVRNPERPDGLVLSVSAQPLPGPTGKVGAVAAFHDVTGARLSATRVEQARDLFAGVLAAATEQAIIATDPDGRITVFNVGAERMLGYREQDMLGSTPERLHDPAEVLSRAAELGIDPGFGVFVHQVAGDRAETRLWTYLTAGGGRLSVQLTVSTIRDGRGAVAGYIGLAVDVTAQRHAERSLRDSEARFRGAFHTAPMGMLLATVDDQHRQITQVNPALCTLLGRSDDELTRDGLLPFVHPDDRAESLQALDRLLSDRPEHDPVERVRLEVRFVRPDGTERWGVLSGSIIGATADAARQVIALVEDITARKHAEQALQHQALHDALTGLANRTLLHDRAEHTLATGARTGRAVGLLYLDLDGFKAVNDLAGHAAGDELLAQTAQRLLAAVRPGDTVARLGGDEFAVLCPDADTPAHLTMVGQRVLAAVRAPFLLTAGTHTVSASIGMALARPGGTAAQLLHDADTAMYGAKRGGKDRLLLHDDADVARAALAVRLLPELAAALERDELVVFGQPVVDLTTGTTVAVEALLRWQHPQRGILPPGEFLAVAEASPLMVPIGQRALHESCRQAAAWLEALGPAAPDVHVNVSGRQLESGGLSSDVLSALARYHLPASRLVLELTETCMPLLTDSLLCDLQRLRERGVRIAIDDLGTGYSSLLRLTELPVDILKIDLSFIRGLGNDPSCDAVVRAVLSIGHSLGLSVIAEGVETPQQADTLTRYGCDTGQGCLYSPPRPEADLRRLLAHAAAGPCAEQTSLKDPGR